MKMFWIIALLGMMYFTQKMVADAGTSGILPGKIGSSVHLNSMKAEVYANQLHQAHVALEKLYFATGRTGSVTSSELTPYYPTSYLPNPPSIARHYITASPGLILTWMDSVDASTSMGALRMALNRQDGGLYETGTFNTAPSAIRFDQAGGALPVPAGPSIANRALVIVTRY